MRSARGIAAQDAALAQRERLQLRQEFVLDEARHGGQPLRLRVEGGMNIEAGASAGAGRAAIRQRRIGVGGVDHARQVAPTSGFSASRSFANPCGRSRASAARESSTDAITPLRRNSARSVARVHDHVGDEAGKIDVVGADRQQHQIELAIGLAALGGGEGFAQFGQLRR